MLAIVIPYFKLEFFEETLSSLANQSNKNFKVYIGNDASPDNPIRLVNLFNTKLNITYKRFDENLGGKSLTEHWDRCIDMVQEEKWLMILGDDDMLGDSVVQTFYNHLEVFKRKSKVVRFASKTITHKSNTIEISDPFQHPFLENAEDSYYRRFRGLTRSSLSEYVYEKETYLKHGFYSYPLAWHSDDRAWLEFSENTPIYTINDAFVFIRNSSLNISSRIDNLDQKNQASIKFYKYIISNKFHNYNMEQRISLIRATENAFLKSGKFKMKEWMFLIFHHLRNFEFNSFKKLIKKFIKSALKNYVFLGY